VTTGDADVQGVFSVLATPFRQGGDVDVESLRRYVEHFIGAGVTGFTALGVLGEAARLTERERAVVLETVLTQVNGRVPVVVGTTTEGLHTCLELSRAAQAAGATAVMVSPPRAPKLNSSSVKAHFAALADALTIPLVIQDFPPVSGFTMEASLLVQIAREIPAARTIKLEDPPTPLKTARLIDAAGDMPLTIFGGLGGVYLLEELMAGSAGAMTGFAFPEILVGIVSKWQAGDRDGAADLFYKTVPLMRLEFQEGIGMAVRKEVLKRRGLIADASTRAPGATIDAGTRAALDRLITWTAAQEGLGWISG
jgi:4-hydroxy-tetrahydrodipicolinate synthase